MLEWYDASVYWVGSRRRQPGVRSMPCNSFRSSVKWTRPGGNGIGRGDVFAVRRESL
jgi:hypothetical protein